MYSEHGSEAQNTWCASSIFARHVPATQKKNEGNSCCSIQLLSNYIYCELFGMDEEDE